MNFNISTLRNEEAKGPLNGIQTVTSEYNLQMYDITSLKEWWWLRGEGVDLNDIDIE